MIWFIFLLMSLTAYRATRLIVKDTFPPVLWLRDRLAGGWRPLTDKEHAKLRSAPRNQNGSVRDLVTGLPPWMYEVQSIDYEGPRGTQESRYVHRVSWSPFWLAELLSCPWCASAYVSGVLTAAVDVTYGIPVPWLIGPAVWAVAAVLASREEL